MGVKRCGSLLLALLCSLHAPSPVRAPRPPRSEYARRTYKADGEMRFTRSMPPQINRGWETPRFSETSVSDTMGDNVAASGWTWKKVSTVGNSKSMSAREGHSAVAVENMLVLFGGCYLDKECFNDITVLDVNDMRWISPVVEGMLPPPREGHSAAMIGTTMYIFGGSSEIGYLDDTHVLDLQPRRLTGDEPHMAWGQPEISGTPPDAREGHSGTAADGSIIVFGGYSDAGYRNDVFVLDTDLMEWTKPTVTGTAPSPREGHSAIMFDDTLVIFGGYTDQGGAALNDVAVLDTRTFVWSSPKMAGEVPKARQDAAAVRLGPKILIVGGCNFYDRICYNDAFELDMALEKWDKPAAAAGNFPAREGHTLTIVRNRPLLTGGCFLDQKCYGGNTIVELTAEGDDFTCGGSNCTGNGLCRHGLCLCLPGFGGSDCGERMHCPKRCSGHGACLNTGHCACELGFSGRDCSFSEPCPQKCSGRGECLQGGVCRCLPGWTGEACDVCRVGSRVACNAKGVCFLNATAPARFASRPLMTAPRNGAYGARFLSGGAALLATSEGTSAVRSGSGQQLYVAEVAQTPAYGCKCDGGFFGPSCTLDAAADPPPLPVKKKPEEELCTQPQFAATEWCSPMSRALHALMMSTKNLTEAKLLGEAADLGGEETDIKAVLACVKKGVSPVECVRDAKKDAKVDAGKSTIRAEPDYDGEEGEAKDESLAEKADWWKNTPGGGKKKTVKGPNAAPGTLRLSRTESKVSDSVQESSLRMKQKNEIAQEQMLVEALMRGIAHESVDASKDLSPVPVSKAKISKEDTSDAPKAEDTASMDIAAAAKSEPGDDSSKREAEEARPALSAPAAGASGGGDAKAKDEAEKAEKAAMLVRRCPETCEHGGGHGRCSQGMCFCVPGYYGSDCKAKVPPDAVSRKQHLIYYILGAGLVAGVFLAFLVRPLGQLFCLPTEDYSKSAPWVGWKGGF